MSNGQPIPDAQWQAAFDKLASASADRNWIIGRLGVKLTSSSADLAVAERPGYYYVSIGLNGELGQSIARDGVGVAAVSWQQIWLRRENSELVICRASSYGGSGGGGGASNLNALTDVTLSAPADGNTLQYNAATGQWVNVVPAVGGGGAPSPHDLSGIHHSGKLNWPLIDFSGSSLGDLTSRPHNILTGIGPNDHHDQAHVLATGTGLGADHSISGAAAGEVLRASGPTTAAFDVLQHTDLGNVTPDQHHTRVHDIITGDGSGPVHTVVGADFTVVGVHPANTLALLPTSSAPGAAVSILKTDANGGIQLDTNLFWVDGANNWVGFNRQPSGAAVDIIAAANADHTQRIKMKSGQTGRLWRIEDLTGNELIVLDSVGNLQSGRPGFVSGLTGWQITPQGNAEFNNIWARGELHATVFVKDEVHATGGTFMVATAGTLHDDAVIDATLVDDDVLVVYSTPAGQGVPLQVVTTSGTFTGTELHVSWIGNLINVNDPPSGPGFYFQPGDVIRSKTEVPTGVTDFWLEVNSAVQNSGYSTYSVTKRSGTDGTLPKGAALVSYGKQGDGRILMTSDLNYAPYIDIFTTGYQVWTGNAGAIIPRVRLGRLDGIGLPGVSGVEQYGLIAGQDLSDANQGYFIASNLQLALYKVNMRLNNGIADTGLWTADGNLKIGSNIGALATTGFQVFTTGARAGDVVIGNESSGYFLRWSQVTGQLTVSGNLIISDPGGTVTKSYVDSQDSAYDSLAQGYGTTAQGNAQVYGDARRLVGVTGTWTSAANQISWASLAAILANGGSRSIANGNTGAMSVRTYLYVNIALTGTLTMLATTNAATINQPGYVLIAVCDPGAQKASVNVVAGSTYISGSNIFAQSILAANIAAHAITANEIAAHTITANEITGGTITSTEIDPGYTNSITVAVLNAQTYSDIRRVVGVNGTWTVVNGNTISWSSLQVKLANGTARSIAFQTNYTLTPAGRHYLYVDLAAVGTLAMLDDTDINSIGVNNALIAVVDTSAIKASISIVAGSTYISGGNIMTGSIVAAHIQAFAIDTGQLAAGAVTAAKISVANLQAVSASTGALSVTDAIAVGTAGNIHSGTKSYGSIENGFFLGYDSTAYKFDVGNQTNWLRWNGTDLSFRTSTPLQLMADGGGTVLNLFASNGHLASVWYDLSGDDFIATPNFRTTVQLQSPFLALNDATSGGTTRNMIQFIWSGHTHNLTYDNSGTLSYDGAMTVAGSFIAGGQVIANANAMRITTPFTPASSSSPAGNVGEIRWDRNFIYVWTDAGAWRRATLNIF